VSLYHRHFVSMNDITQEELHTILKQAEVLKGMQKRGEPHRYLEGKTLAMIFEKPSTRTRVSFEVGMYQLGGHALYLSANDLQLGRGETIEDTAKVLSRYVDCIMARTFSHQTVVDLSKHASVPVINALSDYEHPCQILADLLTIQEEKKRLVGLKLAYIGDGNNVAHSLLLGCAKAGMHVSVAAPKGYWPDPKIVEQATKEGKSQNAQVVITTDPAEAAKDADVLYTDVWISMGQEKEKEERLKIFQPYQINVNLLKHAKPDAIVLHCLPAHRGMEISGEVMDGKQSHVFDEAENRLHTQKALLTLLLTKESHKLSVASKKN
jgi:ornithine carbamoyltransferase